jgi:hypothetical protein
MEVNAMEEGKIYDEAGEEVIVEDMDYAMIKNTFIKTNKSFTGKTEPGFSSE